MGMISTEAINGLEKVGEAAGEFFFGGLKQTMRSINENKPLRASLHDAFGAAKDDALSFKFGKVKNAAGVEEDLYWSGAKVGGGVAGLGIGYRFLSGGGAYRDKNGKTDIAGLPFV
jgi:hypothetical protein